MCDGNRLFMDIDSFFSNMFHHLHNCLVHSSGLIKLTDTSLRSRSHNRFDLQCTGHQSLYSAQTSILTQSFQILQYEKCTHFFNILIYSLYNFLKRKSLFFAFHDLHGNQAFSTGCRPGIKYMDFFPGVILQKQTLSKNRTVVGTAQLRRKCHSINVICFTLISFHITLRRRACGFRTLRACSNFFQKVLLIKSFIIYNALATNHQC